MSYSFSTSLPRVAVLSLGSWILELPALALTLTLLLLLLFVVVVDLEVLFLDASRLLSAPPFLSLKILLLGRSRRGEGMWRDGGSSSLKISELSSILFLLRFLSSAESVSEDDVL